VKLNSPINPFELNVARGRIPVPTLPAPLGPEGVARVREVGSEVSTIKPGDLVFVPTSPREAWRERIVAPAATLFPLPTTANLQQLSMAAVNPPTAGLLLDSFVKLQPGDWIVQNAGNSAMAINIVAFAKARGLHVVSLVRRPEIVAEVEALGSDLVFVESKDLNEKVKKAVGGAKIRLGLDGVGGRSAMSVSGLVDFGGTVAVYSAKSGEPASLNPMDIIFRDIRFRGLFLGHPHVGGSKELVAALHEGIDLIGTGKLAVPVGGVYPLDGYKEAIAQSGKGKKILFKPN
jgi:NADPH:quinone reductase-like Zn-dependent oxidoreductase